MSFRCGYNKVALVRRPYKKMGTRGYSSNLRVNPIGNFDLIPLDEGVFYNKENRTFPFESDVTVDSNTGKHDGRIYLISDPDVGVLIPHIWKQTLYLYHFKSSNIDLDDIVNTGTPVLMFGKNRMESDRSNINYSVSGFLFVQPIFLKVGSDWYAYIPKYRINDADIQFEKISAESFITHFSESSNYINDVVVSNQNIENVKFTQLGIGKNGIELKNGLKYKMDKAGNAEFNIGNIKSDSMTFVKKPIMSNNTVSGMSNIKLETMSYTKGDVLSGTSFSSLLSSILFDIYDELKDKNTVYTCTSASEGSSIATKVINSTPSNQNTFEFRLKYPINSPSPQLTVGSMTMPIRFNNYNEQISLVPAGYYVVTKQSNFWKFQYNDVYHKLNMFMKKISNFDVLLIKK